MNKPRWNKREAIHWLYSAEPGERCIKSNQLYAWLNSESTPVFSLYQRDVFKEPGAGGVDYLTIHLVSDSFNFEPYSPDGSPIAWSGAEVLATNHSIPIRGFIRTADETGYQPETIEEVVCYSDEFVFYPLDEWEAWQKREQSGNGSEESGKKDKHLDLYNEWQEELDRLIATFPEGENMSDVQAAIQKQVAKLKPEVNHCVDANEKVELPEAVEKQKSKDKEGSQWRCPHCDTPKNSLTTTGEGGINTLLVCPKCKSIQPLSQPLPEAVEKLCYRLINILENKGSTWYEGRLEDEVKDFARKVMEVKE